MAKLKVKREIEQAPARLFTTIGDEHIGKLLGIRKAVVDGDDRIIYDMLDLDTEEKFILWSSAVLEQMIDDDLIGEVIGVNFTDQKPPKKKSDNPTRMFKVTVYEAP